MIADKNTAKTTLDALNTKFSFIKPITALLSAHR